MRMLGNILWLIFGGLAVSMEYFAMGIAFCLTLIGIPFGLQLFKLGLLALLPFSQTTAPSPTSNGCISFIMNVLWIFTGGIIISATHLVFGILLTITIIGIPFGMQHFKLMAIAFTPFGRMVVSK